VTWGDGHSVTEAFALEEHSKREERVDLEDAVTVDSEIETRETVGLKESPANTLEARRWKPAE
jgi:hypothetical protein